MNKVELDDHAQMMARLEEQERLTDLHGNQVNYEYPQTRNFIYEIQQRHYGGQIEHICTLYSREDAVDFMHELMGDNIGNVYRLLETKTITDTSGWECRNF